MGLDDLKRALGRLKKKSPMKVVQLQQNAIDAGMNFDDYLLNLHDKAVPTVVQAPAPIPNDSNELQKQVQSLREEVNSLIQLQKTMVNPPPVQTVANIPAGPAQVLPPPTMVDQIKDIATIMTAFKNMFPSNNMDDVLKLVQAVDKLREGVGAEAAEPDMAFEGMKMLGPHMGDIVKNMFKSRSSGAVPTVSQDEAAVEVPKTPEDTIIPEVDPVKTLEKENIKIEIKKAFTPNMKAAIWNGMITLDTMKEEVKGFLKKNKFTEDMVPEEIIEEVYKEILAEDAPEETNDTEEENELEEEDDTDAEVESGTEPTEPEPITEENNDKKDSVEK